MNDIERKNFWEEIKNSNKISMEVNMDGLRWELLNNYNSLVKKLNKHINSDDNTINIEVYDIEREMKQLSMCIITLSYMYDDKPGGFKQLENPTFNTFNEKEPQSV
jgi:hypothetical protein